MGQLRYASFTEFATGRGHPTKEDTINRALRDLLVNSGIDPDGANPAVSPLAHSHPLTQISFADYGAVGDGVADDTAELQAAITANPSYAIINGNGKNYKISSPLTSASSQFLQIVNARFLLAGDHAFLTAAAPTDLIYFFRLDSCYINASAQTTVGRKVIDFSNFNNSLFRSLWILGADGVSDHFYGKKPTNPASYYNKIDQVYLGGMRYGINCDDSGLDTGVNALTITDSRIQPGASRTAVRVSRYCQLIRILNNVFESAGGVGVDIDGKSCEVMGNWFEQMTTGWRMRVNAFDSYIGHNYFSDCVADSLDDTGTPADNYIYVRT